MLSTDDLNTLRNTINQTLTDSATVKRVSRVSDGAGGITETWTQVGTYACRVAPAGMTRQEALLAEKVRDTNLIRIVMPHDADVTNDDRVMVNGQEYNVVGVMKPRTINLQTIVLCTKI